MSFLSLIRVGEARTSSLEMKEKQEKTMVVGKLKLETEEGLLKRREIARREGGRRSGQRWGDG